MNTTLICTVGGSHQPIMKAISVTQPDYVYFVCTDRDPVTSRPGSRVQVDGAGNVIKAQREDEKPTLPNIPTQIGLAADSFEIVIVEADDLDSIFRRLDRLLHVLSADNDRRRLVTDYSGGTKSMSAGLALAALEHPAVELQLIGGARSDLEQVQSGTERAMGAEVERLRIERELKWVLATWRHFAYDDAANLVNAMDPIRDRTLQPILVQAKTISSALAAWDRFDHGEAKRLLEGLRSKLAPLDYVPYFNALAKLTDEKHRGFALLLDLWRNAERRAAQGHYDDAVARCYRLLEASAQWLLQSEAGIDTADVPKERIPENMDLTTNTDGQYQAGLLQAWRLAAHCIGEEVAEFHGRHENQMFDLLSNRNYSILAHGWIPVGSVQWDTWRKWIHAELLPLLIERGESTGIRDVPPQLPDKFPDGLLLTDEGGPKR